MKLQDCKAIISGGISGLGFATAQHIVNAGGQAFLLDVNAEQSQTALNSLGNNAQFMRADVTNESEVFRAVESASSKMNGLNAVVNCAGILGAGRVLGKQGPMSTDYFAQTINVNLIGSFNLSKCAATVMQNNTPNSENERGVIVNTASIAAYEGQIGQAAYAASKAGIIGMTLPMAREFSRFGIRVMTIAPGIFYTPMVDGMPDDVQTALNASIPFPSRLGQSNEYAFLVEHILENVYLNGTSIRLDGATRLQAK